MLIIKSKLKQIHKRVFKGFTYKTDMEQHGEDERWSMPEDVDRVVGDCEDFALACRSLLVEESLPSRLVYCKTELGEGHLVVECEGWVLDNRMKKVVTQQYLTKKGYKFLAISGYNSGDKWYKL